MLRQAAVLRQVALVLGLGCLLGCVLWLAVGRLGRPAVPTEVTLAALQSPPQVSIADALSMPVFNSQRDQNIQPTPAAAPAADQANIRLLGISYTPRRRAAFVSASGQPFWLAVGESRDGVTLTALRRSAADFQVNGAVVQLELFKRSIAPGGEPTPSSDAPAPRGREPASAPAAPATSPPAKADPAPPKPGNG